jgi:hypothetical protein
MAFRLFILDFFAFISSLGQFILIKTGHAPLSFLPYLLMPVATFVSIFYYRRRYSGKGNHNPIGIAIRTLGILLGANLMISGFFFWNKFAMALLPFMLVLLAVWLIVTGFLVRNKTIIISGVLVNAMAYASFFISFEYHSLVMALVSLIGIVFPGIMLKLSTE